MTAAYIVLLLLPTQWIFAQTESGTIPSRVITLLLQPTAVVTVHLGSGYVTSVKLPDDVNSIVIGDASRFKAEHTEAEPRMVFLKSISGEPARSNALITTKSGDSLELDLVGLGKDAEPAHMDLFIDCRRERRSLVISASPISGGGLPNPSARSSSPGSDLLGQELERERAVSFPYWNRGRVVVALGDCTKDGQRTIVAFSVMNGTDAAIEMLPPQVELTASSKKRKQLKAQPVLVSEYRMSSRRIAPGERADGVVEFERPTFKESREGLRLRLAQVDQVDRPLVLPIAFTPARQGDLP